MSCAMSQYMGRMDVTVAMEKRERLFAAWDQSAQTVCQYDLLKKRIAALYHEEMSKPYKGDLV